MGFRAGFSAVAQRLDKQLGHFLRRERGDLTFAQWSRKLGLPASTLHRLENGEQSITLKKLELILDRLKCSITDIFSVD